MATNKLMVAALAVGGLILVSSLFGSRGGSTQIAASGCAQLDLAALQLPPEKADAEADFLARADRLNAAGRCVIEGGYGMGTGQFYFAVHDGPGSKPYHLRYLRDELAPSRRH